MKGKKIIIFLIFIIGVILALNGIILTISCNKLIKDYSNKTYKNTYINGEDISELKYSDLDKKLEDLKNLILDKNIIFFFNDKEVTLKLKDLEPIIDVPETISKIKDRNKKITFLDKVKLLNDKSKFYYNFVISFPNIENIKSRLEQEFNVQTLDSKLVVNENHELILEQGNDGFQLDYEKTRDNLEKYLQKIFNSNSKISDKEYRVEVFGEVLLKKESNIETINKKVSSYSTSFVRATNRGYNIELAASRLNKTIIEPGETFSFLKVVGPYSCANGYKSAPAQNSSGYACGGGVCQVSTTLYNAQLLAGLETVERQNHGEAVAYVPRGLDATVYSTYTDYKFKNQYDYPICIVSYVLNDKLYIDIWTNENALGGKTYQVTSKRLANGGYAAYLLVYENDNLLETRYLHTSFYSN